MDTEKRLGHREPHGSNHGKAVAMPRNPETWPEKSGEQKPKERRDLSRELGKAALKNTVQKDDKPRR
ncbi:hypothetical protein ACWEVP_15435 [Amycolatopsis sp. NPDC003865]